MRYRPHEYQQYAIEYIETHPVSAVLLDMGLGKTSITLTALQDLLFDRFEAHKVLIIAPLRVARNTWPAELQKWEHLQDLTVSVVVGNAEERKAALAKEADLYVINREMVLWLVEQSGYRFDSDTVVIDELSSFKNHQSKRFTSTMADTVVKIIDLQDEINRDIDTLVDLKADIMRLVKSVSCREYQTILEKRYLCFQSWEKIAAAMDYDIRWLYRLHGKALEEVQEILDAAETRQ